jgi:hypothetical protein
MAAIAQPENRLGDPSGRGEGYSFLPDNTGSARRQNGPRQEKKKLQNTTADIRKKKIGELYDMLVELGCDGSACFLIFDAVACERPPVYS